jgi:gamma-glutamyltranspeptidase/glutathione hydrolase
MRSLKFEILILYFLFAAIGYSQSFNTFPVQTQKPPLHAKEWMAITGKPMAATAGSMIFTKGGNAIDASCAMLAATCTMWDVLSWGGEMQGLIYHPGLKKVIAINGLGFAPKAATVEFYKSKGYDSFPPEYGPLAAVVPGIPGTLMQLLADYGSMSLKDVLEPAMSMAQGYPIEAQTANSIERNKSLIKEWDYSKSVFLPHLGQSREAPSPGEIFVQNDLYQTLQKLVDAEQEALKQGKTRKEAIMAAYDRFYKGDIADEFVRSMKEMGGIISKEDLSTWRPKYEEPLTTNYRGIDVYKLQEWTQGPVMLQALNMLENFDLKSMSYNSSNYIHTLYQVMNLSFADRDFYYGDPDFNKLSPIKTLISKEYAKQRCSKILKDKNDESFLPGDPYGFIGQDNPLKSFLPKQSQDSGTGYIDDTFLSTFQSGTTTVVAADKQGWVVSFTPSGGWIPAVIADKTGIGLSQRMQSFVLNASDGPNNVLMPHKRPRVTLSPSLAMVKGKPYMSFAKQAGDEQDQLLLQFFLNVVDFGMTVQEACEAPSFKTYQMYSSFGKHERKPGNITLHDATPPWTRNELLQKGYKISYNARTSGPINAIFFDQLHGTMWGGSSNHGEDYGIGW